MSTGIRIAPITASSNMIIQHIFYITKSQPFSLICGALLLSLISLLPAKYSLPLTRLYFQLCWAAPPASWPAEPSPASSPCISSCSELARYTFYSAMISRYLSMISETAFSSWTEGLFMSLDSSICCPFSGLAMISSTSSSVIYPWMMVACLLMVSLTPLVNFS